MSEHFSSISWARNSEDFAYESFDRRYTIRLRSGLVIAGDWASVPADARATDAFGPRMDPEEGLLSSLMSCHMLTFLALASKKRWDLIGYEDSGVATLSEVRPGRQGVSRIEINPVAIFRAGSAEISEESLAKTHEKAHDHCFIANSITAEVIVNPVMRYEERR